MAGPSVRPLVLPSAGAHLKTELHCEWRRRNNDVTTSSAATIVTHRADMANIRTRIVSNILRSTELTTKART